MLALQRDRTCNLGVTHRQTHWSVQGKGQSQQTLDWEQKTFRTPYAKNSLINRQRSLSGGTRVGCQASCGEAGRLNERRSEAPGCQVPPGLSTLTLSPWRRGGAPSLDPRGVPGLEHHLSAKAGEGAGRSAKLSGAQSPQRLSK